jgi:hypothetical protein
VIIEYCQAELLEIVHALGAGRALARVLNRGQKQAEHDTDNSDHNQQFECGHPEPVRTAAVIGHLTPPIRRGIDILVMTGTDIVVQYGKTH